MNIFEKLGYRVSSEFGWRKDPFDRTKEQWHTGIDLVKAFRSPIEAFTEGTVIFAGEGKTGTGLGGYGICVLIEDKNGKSQVYAHLDSYQVKVGDKIARNQVIARLGNTGKSTGPHLHFEVRKVAENKPPYGWRADRVNNCLEPVEYIENFYPEEKANDDKYIVHKEINGYYRSSDAKNRVDARTKVKPGEYIIFSKYSDTLINITKTKGVPGSWINTEDNVVETPKEDKKKILVLPADAEKWRVYPLDKAPVKGNEKGFIKPKKFGGLTYEILGYPYPNVVTIQTRDFGKVNIYVHPSTGAQIK